nr:hypothetical protein [uncultured Rhodopila sp.]
MKSTIVDVRLAAIALAAAAAFSPALAQQDSGTLYAFHTKAAVGGCPALDWHIIKEADNKLTGFVASSRTHHMASLEGEFNKNGTFQLDLDPQMVPGATGKVMVSGSTRGDYVNLSIDGAGTKCDGITLSIPRVVGGMGGN